MFVDFNILNQLGSPSINSNTFANRPAAGQTGRLFVSTDTFEIYRDNGTGWDLIGGPGSSTVTGSGAAGQVTYWTGSNSVGGNNNLFWDISNERLGIGTTTPSSKVDIAGSNVLLHLKGGSNAYMMYHGNGIDEYQVGYTDGPANYRRFSIYDQSGAKETITIDKQSRYVGINYQYSSLSDQPAYTLDVSGQIRGENLLVNSNGQTRIISTYFGAGTDGKNFYIGGGGLLSSGTNDEGSYNVSLGVDAMLSNTTGSYNVAIGWEALKNITTSYENIAIGYSVLQNITTGYQNTCIGGFSASSITTGYRNTAIGSATLTTATTSYHSVAIGRNALRFATTGYQNTAVGNDALINISTGFDNTSIGYQTGGSVTTGSQNIYIGSLSNCSSSSVTNEIAIGYLSTGEGSNSVTLGNSSITKTILRGNTLIGTTVDAGQKLQVSGNTNFDGNLLVTGNTRRIQALFSGGPAIDRTHFQNSTTNSDTFVGFLPNGTSSSSGIQVYNNSDPTNSTALFLSASSTSVNIQCLVRGTGTFLPINFINNNVTYASIQTNGNFLIGTTTDNGGTLQVNGTIKTDAPTTGTAAQWKLGSRVAAAVALDATQYIEVEVGGTFYKLAIVT